MGDVAMLVQTVRNILEHNLEVKITLITKPFFQVFFGTHDRLNFLAIDTKGRHKGLLGLLNLASEIIALKPDIFIDQHDVLRSQIIRSRLKLSGVLVIIFGKGRKEKTALLNRKSEFEQLPHSIERYNEAARKAGLIVEDDYQFILSTSDHEFKVNPKLKVIGFAPFAAHESKEWGIENVNALLDIIQKEGGIEVLLFGGGKEEEKKIKALTYDFSCTKSVAGQFTLEEEMSVMRSCDVFLAMDSSNMHIADLVGCDVISVWIATHPHFGFYAWSNKENSIVLSRKENNQIPLSIFGKLKSKKDLNMVKSIRKQITPEMIYDKIKTKLD